MLKYFLCMACLYEEEEDYYQDEDDFFSLPICCPRCGNVMIVQDEEESDFDSPFYWLAPGYEP